MCVREKESVRVVFMCVGGRERCLCVCEREHKPCIGNIRTNVASSDNAMHVYTYTYTHTHIQRHTCIVYIHIHIHIHIQHTSGTK